MAEGRPSLARNGQENACQEPNPLRNGHAPGELAIRYHPDSMKQRGHSWDAMSFFKLRTSSGGGWGKDTQANKDPCQTPSN